MRFNPPQLLTAAASAAVVPSRPDRCGGRSLLAAVVLCSGLLSGGCRTPLRPTGGGQTAEAKSTQSATASQQLIEPRPLPMPVPPIPLTAASTPRVTPVESPPEAQGGVGQQCVSFESVADEATIATTPEAVADTWEAPLGGADLLAIDRLLTIDEVLSYTMAHHPVLHAMQHEVEVARAEVITAGLRRNPRFVFATETPVARSGPTELGGRVTLPILTGRKRRLRRAAACTGVRRAELAVSRETQRLLEEAATAAVEVLYLQELVGLNAEISQLATQVSTAADASLLPEQAELRVASQISAEISAVDAEARRLNTATQLAVAQRELARAMGLSPPAAPSVAGRLGLDLGRLVALETILAVARGNRPELAEARVAISESRQQHSVARAEAHPDLEMGPRYIAPLGEPKDRVGVRIDVDLPLFDRNQGTISQTAAQVRVNRARLRVVELSTLSDVASAYAELVELQKELTYYNERVTKLTTKTTTLLTDPAIRQGISDYQELTIRLALAKMRRDRLQLAYRYEQLLTRLQFFLGEPVTSA